MLVGRSWRDRWEDGEEGIWRASDTCATVVAKAAELNDPALCDASTAGSIWNRAAIKILGNSQLSLAKDSALTTATTSIAPLMDEDTLENKETSSVLHEIFGDGPVASKAKGNKGGSSSAGPSGKRPSAGGASTASASTPSPKKTKVDHCSQLHTITAAAAPAAASGPTSRAIAVPAGVDDHDLEELPDSYSTYIQTANSNFRGLLDCEGTVVFPAAGVSSLEAATKKAGIAIMKKFQDAAKEIRKELRKFRRRTDTESKTVALDKLEKLAASEDSIANVFKALMGPVQNNADDLTNRFKELINIGVRFDNVWAIKVVKNMIHDSLMHAHWNNLVGTIFTFIHDHIAGENEANDVFTTQTCVMFRKILSNIPSDKATRQQSDTQLPLKYSNLDSIILTVLNDALSLSFVIVCATLSCAWSYPKLGKTGADRH